MCRILHLAENDALSHKNEDDQIKINVLPPTNATGNITDKESGDENGSRAINNLTGSMLLASVKLDHKTSTMTEDGSDYKIATDLRDKAETISVATFREILW